MMSDEPERRGLFKSTELNVMMQAFDHELRREFYLVPSLSM